MKYVVFDNNEVTDKNYAVFVATDANGKELEDSLHNKHELVKDLLSDPRSRDTDWYISCCGIVYKVCRSSRQATKVTGITAKIVKRAIKFATLS